MVAREEGCGLLQCAKLQRQPRSGETAARRSAIEKRFRSRWRLGKVAQDQEMKKTPNAQRPMPQPNFTIERWVLGVGRWTFAPLVRNGLALAQYPLPHRCSYRR